MTKQHEVKIPQFVFRGGFIAVVLSACATQINQPGSGETIEILDLHCNTDKSVVATALLSVPGAMLDTDGAILLSLDGGLTWSVAARGGDLTGVAPRFFANPRDESIPNQPLVIAGYKSSGFQWTYPLGGWMKSTDSGRSWAKIPAQLPTVSSADPIAWPPRIAIVNETGRQAIIGNSTALLTSDDHGTTWSETRLPVFGIFDSLHHLLTNGHGRMIVIGRSSSIAKGFGVNRTVVVQSDDSGETWSIAMDQPSSASCIPSVVGALDGAILINIGCAGGDRHYFFSADEGRSWQERRYFRYAYGPFELVTELDDKRWIAISHDNRSLVAWTSNNGGYEWSRHETGYAVHSGKPNLHSQSIVPLSRGVVLAYVGDGKLLRSADYGQSWLLVDTKLRRAGTFSLGAHCTDGDGLVVLAGEQGMLTRSLDGGHIWEHGRLP